MAYLQAVLEKVVDIIFCNRCLTHILKTFISKSLLIFFIKIQQRTWLKELIKGAKENTWKILAIRFLRQ